MFSTEMKYRHNTEDSLIVPIAQHATLALIFTSTSTLAGKYKLTKKHHVKIKLIKLLTAFETLKNSALIMITINVYLVTQANPMELVKCNV